MISYRQSDFQDYMDDQSWVPVFSVGTIEYESEDHPGRRHRWAYNWIDGASNKIEGGGTGINMPFSTATLTIENTPKEKYKQMILNRSIPETRIRGYESRLVDVEPYRNRDMDVFWNVEMRPIK